MQCAPTYTGLFQYGVAAAQANLTQRDVKMHSVIYLPIALKVKTMHLGNQGLVGHVFVLCLAVQKMPLSCLA